MRRSAPSCCALLVLLLAACGEDPGANNNPTGDAGAGDPDSGVLAPGEDARVIPTGPDLDNDGIPDDWERMNGLDPNRNDAADDLDRDGLSNRVELLGGTSPRDIDSDDDGVADGEEDRNRNGMVDPGESSPTSADTDGDGLLDGQELGRTEPLTSPVPGIDGTNGSVFRADTNNATTTDPSRADTDGDGVPDGVEDGNKNGRVDVGEADPLDLDSDDDGIADGAEDANHDGMQSPGETSAINPDSDGDGIPDGVELGVATPVMDPDGAGPVRGTDAGRFRPDADPGSKTNPLNPDSDGDGVLDGDEDWNRNGRYEPPAELNPAVADSDGDMVPDGNEGVAVACRAQALKRVVIHGLASADISLGLTDAYSEVSVLRNTRGAGVGIMFRDPMTGVVGVAISRTPAGGALATERLAVRAQMNLAANLSNEQERALITWDRFDGFQTTGDGDPRTNRSAVQVAGDIAERLAGAGNLMGGLPNAGGNANTFTVYWQTVLRTNQRSVVVAAVAAAPTSDAQLIALADITNGTALGQFGDFTGLGCDPLRTPPSNDVLDLLWVVDNSCSMAQEQANVAAAGNEMVALLGTTQLSWRLALTATDQYAGSITANGVNGFTPSAPRPTAEAASRAWAQAVGALGTRGNGEEKGLVVGIAAATSALPASANERADKFRAGATVVVVHMSDEEDFSVKQAANGDDNNCPDNAMKQARINELRDGYLALGRNMSISGLTTFAIHGTQPARNGVPCAFDSMDCAPESSMHGRSYLEVAAATGGGSGSICGNMGRVVQDIIRAGAGIASQIELSLPPISSTIRVVVADANGNLMGQPDVPRSRTNGFDYAFELDVAARRLKHKIVFYGNARPPPSRDIVVSYRTWNDGSPTAGGPPCECPQGQICDPDTNACEVDPTCGGMPCPMGQVCNPQTGMCRPDDPCMGRCMQNEACNPDTATCLPEDPCMGRCDSATQYCDTTGPTPTCRNLL